MSQSDLNLHWSAWAWAMLASSGSQASSIMSEAGGCPVCPLATRERSLERGKILWKICETKKDLEENAPYIYIFAKKLFVNSVSFKFKDQLVKSV